MVLSFQQQFKKKTDCSKTTWGVWKTAARITASRNNSHFVFLVKPGWPHCVPMVTSCSSCLWAFLTYCKSAADMLEN